MKTHRNQIHTYFLSVNAGKKILERSEASKKPYATLGGANFCRMTDDILRYDDIKSITKLLHDIIGGPISQETKVPEMNSRGSKLHDLTAGFTNNGCPHPIIAGRNYLFERT